MANRLSGERSPYLRQHAQNPVDWYPWGSDAFAKARGEHKPIFLSVGYATCHWCHVMEHESFENPAVAAVLNEHFVSIKVDREERPDVDRVYMLFVQATTGQGGWPMSVWLTPELKPFFGGTYFPPDSRWGRPGFIDLLSEIARTWRDEPARVHDSAAHVFGRLQDATARASRAESPAGGSALDLSAALRHFQQAFDARHGGFGDAPKFPRPSELLFLLRVFAATGNPSAKDMALDSLRAMALGGVRDHVGGGFHRYAVDAAWRVPHFEKMLYDQAQLIIALTEAWHVSGDAFYLTVAEDTVDYVRRDLTDAEGGFYSAEDADSVPPESAGGAPAHKSEGAFYLWTLDEIRALLGAHADIVSQRFGFEEPGNAPQDPLGEFRGKNIPYVSQPIETIAARCGVGEDAVMAVLAAARPLMQETRARRPRPELDDKVLTAWNGLMIAALSRVARAEPSSPTGGALRARALEAAAAAAAFIRTRLWDASTTRLYRSFRETRAPIEGFCEDYAFLCWGLLELFQASGNPQWLAWALEVTATQDELFWDEAEGGWFSTTGADPTVLLRLKEDYDGAEPSGGSVATMNAIVLSQLTGGEAFRQRAGRALSRVSAHRSELARALPFLLAAQVAYEREAQQVVIVTTAEDEGHALRDVLVRQFAPGGVTIVVAPRHRDALIALMPALAPMRAVDGRATAYVCRDFVCHAPTTDPVELARQLGVERA